MEDFLPKVQIQIALAFVEVLGGGDFLDLSDLSKSHLRTWVERRLGRTTHFRRQDTVKAIGEIEDWLDWEMMLNMKELTWRDWVVGDIVVVDIGIAVNCTLVLDLVVLVFA